MLHRTSGGSSESAEKEFAVSPSNLPEGVCVVMTVTPVAKRPSALRNLRGSTVSSFSRQLCIGSLPAKLECSVNGK